MYISPKWQGFLFTPLDNRAAVEGTCHQQRLIRSWMCRLIWVFTGHTSLIVGFVVWWLSDNIWRERKTTTQKQIWVNNTIYGTCIGRSWPLLTFIHDGMEEAILSIFTVFDLITAHTPISTQSRNSVGFRLQPVYFFLYVFIKAYVVGTHLNCIDLSIQFKWVPTTYAFIKKIRKKIALSSLNKSYSDF